MARDHFNFGASGSGAGFGFLNQIRNAEVKKINVLKIADQCAGIWTRACPANTATSVLPLKARNIPESITLARNLSYSDATV